MKQKLISLMIIASALAGLLPGAAFAEGDTQLIEKSFTYVENFDSIENGKLPEGWKLYRNKSGNAAKTIKAEVRNGALELTDNNQYSKSYVIFDLPGLQDVYCTGFEMECDITLGNSLGIDGDNKENDSVGFVYGFDESEILPDQITEDADGVRVVNGGVPNKAANRVLLYTNKGVSTVYQSLTCEMQNENGLDRQTVVNSTVDKINTEGKEQKMKLKIYSDRLNYRPKIYLNDDSVAYTNGFITPYHTSGKVGLYINDTAVTIDNVKITATGMVPDIKMYTAGFRTQNGKYADADEAKADVEVLECDCFGNAEKDVTEESIIEAEEDLDGNITINVSYGDFTKTLTTKVADFDLLTVGEVYAEQGCLKVSVSNNSKKNETAVIIVCPMKDGVPFGKKVYFKNVALESKEKDKETEFIFEYDGDDTPDSYKVYFIDSLTNGFRAAAPMVMVNN